MTELDIDQPAQGVTRLRLNRPGRLNALTPALLAALESALERASHDRACRVVVITGAGRGFCAGVDLGYVDDSADNAKGNPGELIAGNSRWSALITTLRATRQPVIAAVNGPATGAGLALVLGSDIRLASSSAVFAASFVRVGLSGGDMGTSWLLPRIVGAARAQELMLTGRKVGAEEALRIGLVVDVVPDDDLDARVLAVAEQVVGNSPFGVAMTKEVMWTALETPALHTAIAMETRTQSLCACSDDHWEAVAAFVEKRPPRFSS